MTHKLKKLHKNFLKPQAYRKIIYFNASNIASPSTASNNENDDSDTGDEMVLDEEFIKKMKDCKVETESNQAQISKQQGYTLVKEFIKANKKFDEKTAFIAIAIICQKGGTSKKAQGDIYAVVDGQRATLKMVRDIKEAKNLKFTIRQWARTFGTEIYTIASHFGIEGDLYKKIARKYSNITDSEAVWLSNFQMDNAACPENCRNMIQEHFSSLFPGSTKILKD